MNEFDKFYKRLDRILFLFREHEGYDSREYKVYDEFYIDLNERTVDIKFYTSTSCGEDTVEYISVTTAMLENPEQEIAKWFQDRELKEKQMEMDRAYVEASEDAIKRAEAELDEQEEYKRLHAKYKDGLKVDL